MHGWISLRSSDKSVRCLLSRESGPRRAVTIIDSLSAIRLSDESRRPPHRCAIFSKNFFLKRVFTLSPFPQQASNSQSVLKTRCFRFLMQIYGSSAQFYCAVEKNFKKRRFFQKKSLKLHLPSRPTLLE